MGNTRASSPLNEFSSQLEVDDGTLARTESEPPGTVGVDAPIPLRVARIIAKVTKDWDPPAPSNSPEIVVRGRTVDAVGRQLDALPEWGQAGSVGLRTDMISPGNSTDLPVMMHANLVYRLPRWADYDQASAAAKAEWDRMFAKLRVHEDRHLAISVEEADQLASDLVGRDISDIAKMVTAANRTMQTRQNQLDTDTTHGSRAGVPYGDVSLDTTIV